MADHPRIRIGRSGANAALVEHLSASVRYLGPYPAAPLDAATAELYEGGEAMMHFPVRSTGHSYPYIEK
jgi:hypothetical protein